MGGFNMPTLARALQGFSAGVAGRGQEFLEGQQKQELQLAQALASDARTALKMLQSDDLEGAANLFGDRVSLIESGGRDATQSKTIRDAIASGDKQRAISLLQPIERRAVDIGLLEAAQAPEVDRKFDLKSGRYVEVSPEGQISGGMIPGFEALGISPEEIDVQSSKILDDGTTVMVLESGMTRVVDPAGNELRGEDRQNAVREAARFGAEIQQERARGRTFGSESVKGSLGIAKDAFKQLGSVNKNIRNLDRVVSALDRGAKTGAVERFLPSIKAASVELDNLRRELGLDVISGVTFGALSEGELQLALDTALPTGLDEAQLKDWAQRKKSAQQKLASELEQAARHFSLGGSINSFLDLKGINQSRDNAVEDITQPQEMIDLTPDDEALINKYIGGQ